MGNPLRELRDLGQSVWLDDIRRDLLTGGGLARLVEEDGLAGVTSNPSIFEKAIAGSDLYDAQIRALLAADPGLSTGDLYEALVVDDIRGAADVLAPVWEASGGADGYVSLEVSPHLARDTAGTVAEARRLWERVDRPNLMIKVPATPEGIPAIEELIAGGINVNVTLIFSVGHYEAAAGAYRRGVERSPAGAASVASLFVSRTDTAVDRELEALGTSEALALRGRIAVANARAAYGRFLELFPAAVEGGRVQRPLWASTSTKNPAYPDVKYVEELVAPHTVNTLPRATLEAFRDHGRAEVAITPASVAAAHGDLERLARLGIDLERITTGLQEAGVRAFAEAFDRLFDTLNERRRAVLEG